MVDAVEAFADVAFDNPVMTFVVHQNVDMLQCHCRVPHGAESVGVREELCF